MSATNNLTKAALEFAGSPRGQLIISQALHYGILALEGQDEARREESNLADMRYLFVGLFPIYGHVVGVTHDQEEPA